jgi:hypothetical protein
VYDRETRTVDLMMNRDQTANADRRRSPAAHLSVVADREQAEGNH